MNDVVKEVKNFIINKKLIIKGDNILLAVSGGSDSVALFYILKEIQKEIEFSLGVFHLNHSLRKEADSESLFVKELCEKESIPFFFFKKDITKLSQENKISLEEAGREKRYELLKETMQKNGFNKAATAHHKDDNAETILMNILRGSALKGLQGIPVKSNNIIRPLLCISKKDIETYLTKNKFLYKTDLSNFDIKYTRNNIRHNLIPLLEEINPKYREHLESLSNTATEALNFIEIESQTIEYTNINNEIKIDYNIFKDKHIAVKKQIILNMINKFNGNIKDISSKHIENIIRQFDINSNNWSIDLPHLLTLSKSYNKLILRGKNNSINIVNKSFPIGINGIFVFPNKNYCLNLNLSKKFQFKSNNIYKKAIDYDKINGNLKIRCRQNGDKFSPLGLNGTKSLKEYFIDKKIPKEERDFIPILCDDEKILWIIGYTISEDVKITNETKTILNIEYIKTEGNSNA